jgi:hypothetical protein
MQYTKWLQNSPNDRTTDQIAAIYTRIFHCKSLQNLPKLGVWALKYAKKSGNPDQK